MRIKTVLGVVLAAAVLTPAVLYAADEEVFKYAYVNMERLVDEYVLFAEAEKEAEAKIEAARVGDAEKLAEYQARVDELEEKLSGPLAPEAKEATMAEYKAVVQEALDFRNGVLAEYKRIERDAFETVYKNVYEKIASYAIKNDYEVVFDYSAILLYANDKYDITEDIVTELNEEAGIEN
jgi:Skp family chaperone for outer membrane proteins